MLFQKCPELKGYVALMAQFLPTFEQRKQQDDNNNDDKDEGEYIEETRFYEGDLGGIK